MTNPVILVRDWRSTEAALLAARADGTSPVLITPEGARVVLRRGYLAALQARAEREFSDIEFELIVDLRRCAWPCAWPAARWREADLDEQAQRPRSPDIARQMGARLVRRPS